MKGKTSSGFKFEIDEKNINNMEFIDALAEMNDGNGLAVSKVATMLLGDEQKKKLYDHIRTNDGIVPVEDFAKEITEIFESKEETKN